MRDHPSHEHRGTPAWKLRPERRQSSLVALRLTDVAIHRKTRTHVLLDKSKQQSQLKRYGSLVLLEDPPRTGQLTGPALAPALAPAL